MTSGEIKKDNDASHAEPQADKFCRKVSGFWGSDIGGWGWTGREREDGGGIGGGVSVCEGGSRRDTLENAGDSG